MKLSEIDLDGLREEAQRKIAYREFVREYRENSYGEAVEGYPDPAASPSKGSGALARYAVEQLRAFERGEKCSTFEESLDYLRETGHLNSLVVGRLTNSILERLKNEAPNKLLYYLVTVQNALEPAE